jgi:hypothetical protein
MTETPEVEFQDTPARNEMIDKIAAAFTREVTRQQQVVFGDDKAKVRSEAAAVFSRLDLAELATIALNIVAFQMVADMRAVAKDTGGTLDLTKLNEAIKSNPKIMFKDNEEAQADG